ncbi:MAG TPA: LysR family transcriptional regulator [Candidatus Ventrimonas merdavium]|nr:LysR family transcriptional regulator [Candidatus Ventrimonas merdavium]
MNIHQLEYVITISEEKSFSKAAERLLVTQPALSQQVKKLEIELGTKLFRRERNELVLTDAGKVYVHGARAAVNIYYRALEDIKKLTQTGRKQITVIYNNSLLPDFTSDIFPAFQTLCPDVVLSTVVGNVSVAKDYLLGGMADLAVMASREATHSLLEFIPLRKEELLLAMPADTPLTDEFRKYGVNFDHLKDSQFIMNQSNSFFRMLEREAFSSHAFAPKILCEISDLTSSAQMVQNHKGLAFLPRSMKTDEAQITRFSLTPPAEFFVVIAYHKGAILTKPMKSLIRVLLEAYDGGLA